MRGGRWLLLVLILALLAGCGRPSGAGALVKWRRTGGIAGVDQGLAIAPSGEVQAQTSGRLGLLGQLSRQESAELKRLLAVVEPASLRSAYTDPKVADALFERVSLEGEPERWAVQVGTGGEPPAELEALLAFLRRLYEQYRPT